MSQVKDLKDALAHQLLVFEARDKVVEASRVLMKKKVISKGHPRPSGPHYYRSGWTIAELTLFDAMEALLALEKKT